MVFAEFKLLQLNSSWLQHS